MITVTTTVEAPLEKTWESFTQPEHITRWNQASEDWHTPRAENDLRTGGKFKTRMEAKDGSMGFAFEGTYTNVVSFEQISYVMPDGRKVDVRFINHGNSVEVIESFDPEQTHSLEMQRGGWQAILDSFRTYTESLA